MHYCNTYNTKFYHKKYVRRFFSITVIDKNKLRYKLTGKIKFKKKINKHVIGLNYKHLRKNNN